MTRSRRAVEGYEKSLAIADEKILATFRRDREREAGVERRADAPGSRNGCSRGRSRRTACSVSCP